MDFKKMHAFRKFLVEVFLLNKMTFSSKHQALEVRYKICICQVLDTAFTVAYKANC